MNRYKLSGLRVAKPLRCSATPFIAAFGRFFAYMEAWLYSSLQWLFDALALPSVGLSAIFTVALVSATLLPLGSEPAVFGYLQIAEHMFWPAVLVATLGNTVGGVITYGMGYGAEKAVEHYREKKPYRPRSPAGGRWHDYVSWWLHRLGPPALLFSWLPIVGDPLCAVAGWLKMPLAPSIVYMAIGKFLRYFTMTSALLWFFPGAA